MSDLTGELIGELADALQDYTRAAVEASERKIMRRLGLGESEPAIDEQAATAKLRTALAKLTEGRA